MNSMNSASRSTSESSAMMSALAIKLSTADGWLLFVAIIEDKKLPELVEQSLAVANTMIGAIETIEPIPMEWFNKMRDAAELVQQWPNLAPDLYSITNETREFFISEILG